MQTDAFPENHASVVVCQLTSELVDAPDFRVTIDPKPENGLRFTSQVMADKPVTVNANGSDRRSGVSAARTWLGSPPRWGLFSGLQTSTASAAGTADDDLRFHTSQSKVREFW